MCFTASKIANIRLHEWSFLSETAKIYKAAINISAFTVYMYLFPAPLCNR